jgi:hypothetical protein
MTFFSIGQEAQEQLIRDANADPLQASYQTGRKYKARIEADIVRIEENYVFQVERLRNGERISAPSVKVSQPFVFNHSSASEKYTPMECIFQKQSFQNS